MSLYLTIQCVKVNGTDSCNMQHTMGVPQGIVLGTMLLSLQMNELLHQCCRIEFHMYADFVTVLYTELES